LGVIWHKSDTERNRGRAIGTDFSTLLLSEEDRAGLDELRAQHNPLTESSTQSQAEWWWRSWRR
jgi:hypothetical protein